MEQAPVFASVQRPGALQAKHLPGGAQLKGEGVRALRDFNQNRIVYSFVRIVLGEFDSQASGLDTDCGITLRIKSGRASQNLSGDLVLLQRNSGMIQRVLCEIAKQFAERFRAVKDMAFGKSLYLLEAFVPSNCERVCDSHRPQK